MEPTAEELKQRKQLDEARKYVTQGAIVKVMKAKKSYPL